MKNSLDGRRGAKFTAQITEYRAMKNEIKKKFDNSKLMSSTYFEHFDETDIKHTSGIKKYYLEIAASIAMESTMLQKHGAVIVHKKNIIASGFNYHHETFSIHAEVAAISSLKGKEKDILSECSLYVVRIGPSKYDNALKYSKPCFNCQHTILKHNIKSTYYSTNYDYDTMRHEE